MRPDHAMSSGVEGFRVVRSRHLILVALAVAVAGVLLGSAPSGSEPDGVWVACGPALFHDWAHLPDPSCAAAYQPFQTLSLIWMGISVTLLAVAISRGIRRRVDPCSLG